MFELEERSSKDNITCKKIFKVLHKPVGEHSSGKVKIWILKLIFCFYSLKYLNVSAFSVCIFINQ